MLVFKQANAEANFDFSNATAFEVFSDVGITSTTNEPPNWVTKLSGTTIEAGEGKYVVCWYSEITNSGNNNIVWFRCQFKKTSEGIYTTATEIDSQIPRAESFNIMSGFRVFDVVGEDTIDFRVQFARESGTARIQNCNVYIFRVAI
jgi:hypothetical protein